MALVQAGPEGARSAYRAELLDEKGNVLASRRFDMRPMAFDDTVHGGGAAQGFSFFMRAVDGVSGVRIYEADQLVFERAASGPPPGLRLAGAPAHNAQGAVIRWAARSGASNLAYRVRFSPDGGQTWKVLALNAVEASLTVPAHLLPTAIKPLVEVQATDGVRTDTSVISLR
jgi:hypothetical protein